MVEPATLRLEAKRTCQEAVCQIALNDCSDCSTCCEHDALWFRKEHDGIRGESYYELSDLSITIPSSLLIILPRGPPIELGLN